MPTRRPATRGGDPLVLNPGGGSRSLLQAAALTAALCLAAAGCSADDRPRPTGTATRSSSATAAGPSTRPTVTVAPQPPRTVATPSHPAFPAVAALRWLDGAGGGPALRVDAGGFVRWQGSVPGEQAELLPGGGYRWAGRDGSMVGCAVPPTPDPKRLHCIGVDGAGNTAVTSEANGPRVVYRPDGLLYGEFRADGTAVPVAAPPPDLARAISESGVDMASLVDFATGRQSFAGGVTGDPHLITIGGVRVTTQQAGDFWARSGDQAHQIQIRVAPMPYQSDVSYVTAVGLGFSGHRLEFSLTGSLSIDGATVPESSTFHETTVADGPVVGLWPPDSNGVIETMVLWPDGSTVFMSADSSLGLTLITRLPSGPVGGLFGSVTAAQREGAPVTPAAPAPNTADGAAGGRPGDFASRSWAAATSGALDPVVDSWRVRSGESLFAESASASEQLPDLAAPVSPAAILSAENSCAATDMATGADLAACVFDVSRTGDDGYVVPHAELATAAAAPAVPASLATDWPALTLGKATLGAAASGKAASGKASSPEALAPGGLVDASVAAGGRRVYRIIVNTAARLLITGAPCPVAGNGDHPARGAAALRLFDDSGRPVSTRRSTCGPGGTGLLAPGVYYLVLAGAESGAAATFRLRVTLG